MAMPAAESRDWAMRIVCVGKIVARRVGRKHLRRGIAVVELAVLLPLLVLLFAIAVDFARIYYCSLSLTNCARAGALYASDPSTADESPFASVQAAALSDATNLSPQPTITSATGLDGSGRFFVTVTADHTFRTMVKLPGVPRDIPLQRRITMFRSASVPN
jgi:Flp pilus assembly protein TadG